MTITSNVTGLTPDEIQALLKCKTFTYTYGVGLIYTDNGIIWDCNNSCDAKDYLLSNKKKEE